MAEAKAMNPDMIDLERKVARSRILLALFAISAAYLVPNNAILQRWGVSGAGEAIEPYALMVLAGHLGYSLVVYGALVIGLVPTGMVAMTTWVDILAGTLIAYFTTGPASPYYVYFAFAVVAAGVRGGFRFSIMVIAVCIWLYLVMSIIAAPQVTAGDLAMYIMRPAYLAIIGYLVAYLGRLRLNLEAKLHALERAKERGEIARALHDGCVQTLAGTNLTLGSCQELVRRGRADEAVVALSELQTSITREYDALRMYIQELADRDPAPTSDREFATRFSVRADFSGSGQVVEHILNIMLEGARNVRRHAFARSASIEATSVNSEIRMRIDDDGLGFAEGSRPPWSIASRVDQLGGRIQVDDTRTTGAHLAIAVRAA
ncbi:MAG TPA: histidine kinase [Candidatus Binatia bacterium]|nr:histidine kinase [Candidatus Binatia bacterium]